MSIGERLKEERQRLKLSQTAFGLLAGAGKTTVISWERGTAFPNAQFLEQAALVGADVRYIVTGMRVGPAPLKPEEQLLLDRYRASSPPLRDAALRVLLGGVDAHPQAIEQQIGVNHGQVTKSGKIVVKTGGK